MTRHRLTAALAAATSVGLVAAGLVLGAREIAPYFSSGFTPEERFNVLAGGDVFPAVSRFGRDMYLDECASTALGSYASFQPVERRAVVIENCLVQARALQRLAPLDARIWIVSAELEAAQGNLDAARAALQRSRETSPFVVAFAIRRILVADTYLFGDPGQAKGRATDMASLFYSRAGIDYLGSLYARNPDDREALTSLASRQEPKLQEAFLSAVQKWSAASQ